MRIGSLDEYLLRSGRVIAELEGLAETLEEVIDECVACLKNGNKIIFCGNGGSAADAQHFAAELSGRFLKDRDPLAAISLTVDTSALTAIGNDYGFDQVFSRQLAGVGRAGDILFGMSTSGNSKNVINAFEMAKDMKIRAIGIVGAKNCKLDKISDNVLKASSIETNHIQEAHLVIGHYLCGRIEERMFQ